MFPRLLPHLLKLVVVFIPFFVVCNTITLMLLQRGIVEPRSPSAAAHEAETKAESPLPVLGGPPHTERALAHGEQHPEPEAALTALEQEAQPATAELHVNDGGNDPKPEPTPITPVQTQTAAPKVQLINGGRQHPGPEATLTAPEQTHPATITTTTTRVRVGVDVGLRKTSKRSGMTRQFGTLSTQRVFNVSITLRNNSPDPKIPTQCVHGG
ncbi:hypothetical protein PG994_010940 [Apiospora phragmitis]|uniref:Uncharacterized protein n=1 Tax=Apiospora phragmitis TaxID=2905665 RepID=A0ABR1TRC6_9PEZI